MGIDIALVGMARGDTVFQQGGDQRAIGAEQLRLWRGLRVGPVIDIDAGVIGEACLVPSFGGTASGRDATRQRQRVDVLFQYRVAGGAEVHHAFVLIQGKYILDHPVAGGECGGCTAVHVDQVQVRKSAALGTPQERVAAIKKTQVVV